LAREVQKFEISSHHKILLQRTPNITKSKHFGFQVSHLSVMQTQQTQLT
jgi:hypothetical protein